ncbi:efflux transporter outer membrane subunit [Siculibacillus lacustris]|uniref:Efflux transporter outer membrane subunit n=1 Tax=Siculibacillus lacustris TaxID=1549641 RepID=A0A4Q9VVD7_9HYPH|nr:efflux transporter outer membrane subunit [Siculibacillus lacustris]TBW40099.1 efflux transporter outer membrane subunit [Siculibacillus lacustris]
MSHAPQTIDRTAVEAAGGAPGRRLRALLCGVMVAALAACGADVTPPDVAADLPARWRDGPTGGPGVDKGWVAAFGSRELVRLVGLAEVDNLDLAAATARIAQAEAQVSATAAGLSPTLSASGDASRRATPGTLSRASPPFHTQVSNSFSLAGDASWQLDLSGRVRALTAAQSATLEATRFDREAIRLSTVTNLVDAYLAMAAAEDRLRIARDNVTTAERTLAAIKRRLEVGTATALDLAQQESVVATQRATLPDLEIERRQQRNAIVVLTGRAPEAATVAGDSLSRLSLPRIGAGVPARLLTRRPDIAQAEATLAAQAANVAAARAAFLPDVALTGSAGFESAFLKNLLRPDALAASIAGSVAETIFDGGKREADLDAARARHSELAATYRKTVHTALADVENALVAIEQNRRHETLQAAVVTAARKAQRLTEERLSEGTIDVTTVLDAERTLFQAEQTLIGVRLARFQAVVALVAALGGGWDREAAASAATTTTAEAKP